MIKKLTSPELPRIRPLMEAFMTEIGYPKMDWEVWESFWKLLFENKLGEIFYFEEGQEIIAAFGASFAPDHFSGILHACEQFWYVLEDKRENHRGLSLFNQFEAEARLRRCKKIAMIHLAHSKEEVLPKFYARQGYTLAECYYWKSI